MKVKTNLTTRELEAVNKGFSKIIEKEYEKKEYLSSNEAEYFLFQQLNDSFTDFTKSLQEDLVNLISKGEQL